MTCLEQDLKVLFVVIVTLNYSFDGMSSEVIGRGEQ